MSFRKITEQDFTFPVVQKFPCSIHVPGDDDPFYFGYSIRMGFRATHISGYFFWTMTILENINNKGILG